ncbi:hypothetical protein RvY_05570 [Ramazzottius varieornatus]|uniref:Secreted protein n=1 Tax=Ramazzottius varieornatus TaxID=947166 RepID=A0A1D1V5B4_RAMVA|nr:hypothetical protein RvY_05570 [Ramazzottius varieornatus]
MGWLSWAFVNLLFLTLYASYFNSKSRALFYPFILPSCFFSDFGVCNLCSVKNSSVDMACRIRSSDHAQRSILGLWLTRSRGSPDMRKTRFACIHYSRICRSGRERVKVSKVCRRACCSSPS